MDLGERRSEKILLVDDEENVQRVLSMGLESLGYMTLTASSGEEAIEIARAEKPDLILMDIVMPGISGFEACRRLKKDRRTWWMPIIIISALDREVDRELVWKAGADGYLTKPIRISTLRESIRAFMESAKGSRFSKRLRISFEDLMGRAILLEFDPSMNYEVVTLDFIYESQKNGLKVKVLDFTGTFPLIEGVELVRVETGRAMSALAEAMQGVMDSFALVVYTLTELILNEGFKPAYVFTKRAIQLPRNGVTMLFLLAPGAHEEREGAILRTLFSTQIRLDEKGMRLVKGLTR
jgi:CheY-like chemotaxis protein